MSDPLSNPRPLPVPGQSPNWARQLVDSIKDRTDPVRDMLTQGRLSPESLTGTIATEAEPIARSAGADAAVQKLAEVPEVAQEAATRAVSVAADPAIAEAVDTPGTATRTAVGSRAVEVTEGRYRRILHEARDLAPSADLAPLINAHLAQAGGTDAAELVLPEGEFTLSSAAAALAGASVRLVGAGSGKTRLTITGDRPGITVGGTSAQHSSGSKLAGMTIDGNGSTGNQMLVRVQYADDFEVSDLVLRNAGNNGLNVFNSTRGKVRDVEITGSRDFGCLVYQSSHITIEDLYVHDLTGPLTGGGHLGLQFKSSQYCTAVRPRIVNIAGYGIYTWDDGTQPDEGHTIIDPYIAGITASPATSNPFAATGIYINETVNAAIRGGRLLNTGAPIASIVGFNAPGLRLVDISQIENAGGTNVGLTGELTAGWSIHNVHGQGGTQGFVFTNVRRGQVAFSSAINTTGTGSELNAGCRVRSGTRDVTVMHSDFSDYRATPVMFRGIYEDGDTGGNNKFIRNTAKRTTRTNVFVMPSSLNLGNETDSTPMA